MAFAPLRRTRLNQPNGEGIDWSNPLTNGLWFLLGYGGGTPRDCVTGRVMSKTGSPVISLGRYGQAINATGSSDNYLLSGMPLIPSTSGLTVSILCEVDAQNATRKRAIRLAGGASTIASIDYSDGSAQDYLFGVQKVGATFTAQHGTVSPYPLGPKLLTLVQDAGSSSTIGYENGTVQTGASTSVAGNLVASIDSIYLTNSTSGFPLNGRLYFAAVWTRALLKSEVISLYSNPWQVFL